MKKMKRFLLSVGLYLALHGLSYGQDPMMCISQQLACGNRCKDAACVARCTAESERCMQSFFAGAESTPPNVQSRPDAVDPLPTRPVRVNAGASHCVQFVHKPNGEVEIKNACDQQIFVNYCVDNPRSIWNCNRNGQRKSQGAKTLGAGRSEAIPEFAHDGGGRIWAASCVYPSTPNNWTPGANGSYSCR